MDLKTIDLEPYRAAVREKICSFCLDHGPTGCNRAVDHPCSLITHLDLIVPAILSVRRSPDLQDYADALRRQVCPNCREDLSGSCALRDLSECALDSYLLRVIEVIEEVSHR